MKFVLAVAAVIASTTLLAPTITDAHGPRHSTASLTHSVDGQRA